MKSVQNSPSPSWPMVPLGEVLDLQRRWVELDATREYAEIGVRSFGRGIFHKPPVLGASLGNKRVLRICPGDLVFMNVFAWEGAVAVAGPAENGMIGSHRFATYTVQADRSFPEYLQWFFRTAEGRDLLGRCSPGSAGRNRTMNLDLLPRQSIPLPPLPEQRRIVAKIDQLAARIEEARGLKSLSTRECESLPVSTRNEFFRTMAGRLQPVALGEVADSRLGKMLSRNQSTDDGATPYLRNANVQWDRLDLTSIYRMNLSAEDRQQLALEPGDILVCEGGDIGKSAMWNGEIPGCIYQKALHRVRCDRSRVLPRFMLYHIFWAAEQGHFADIKTQTTIAHLTGVRLKKYPVFCPALAEQHRIVEYLDNLQAKADGLKPLQAQTAAELDALRPSILDKAFKGEL